VEQTYPEIKLRVAGVFKGGGAKGIVYAGALREVRARGIWFDSVAGSSAGAITATLIACGFDPETLAVAAREALATVPSNVIRGFLPWADRSWFRTDELEVWLENQLRSAVGASADAAPVTFRDLAQHERAIELNVVAMDLDRRQPVVFNATTTPNASIARAVVASCAIPMAMPPGRVLLPSAKGESYEVHRIVDGGAWANYPAFVYNDPSFRKYAGLPDIEPNHLTLGFVIVGSDAPPGAVSTPPPLPVRPDPERVRVLDHRKSAMDKGSGRRAGIVGPLLSWTVLRWITTILVPVVACLTMLLWLQDDSYGVLNGFRWAGYARIPASQVAVLIVGVSTIIALGLVILQLRFGHEIVDVGFPSAWAALSVGPGIPDWTGAAAGERVIRLWPPEQVTTLTLKVPPHVSDRAIKCAGESASVQLDRLFPQYLRTQEISEPAIESPIIVMPAKSRREKLKFWAFAVIAAALVWYFMEGQRTLVYFAIGPLIAMFFWAIERETDRTIERNPPPPDPKPPPQRRPVLVFVMTMLLSFCTINGITWFVSGRYPALVGLAAVVVVVVLWKLSRQLLLGRIHNLRLTDDQAASNPHPLPPLIVGACTLGFGIYWLARIEDVSAVRTYPLVLGTGFILFGIGQLMSACSRMIARHHAKRFERDISRYLE
jgi:hypothetical protein